MATEASAVRWSPGTSFPCVGIPPTSEITILLTLPARRYFVRDALRDRGLPNVAYGAFKAKVPGQGYGATKPVEAEAADQAFDPELIAPVQLASVLVVLDRVVEVVPDAVVRDAPEVDEASAGSAGWTSSATT